MNIVSIWLWLFHYGAFSKLVEFSKLTQAQKVSPGGAIFCSVLAANIRLLWFTAKNFEPDTA
jgi:hypothetical protein